MNKPSSARTKVATRFSFIRAPVFEMIGWSLIISPLSLSGLGVGSGSGVGVGVGSSPSGPDGIISTLPSAFTTKLSQSSEVSFGTVTILVPSLSVTTETSVAVSLTLITKACSPARFSSLS